MKNIIKKAITALTAAVVAATSLAASFGFSASAAVNDTAEIYYNTRFVSLRGYYGNEEINTEILDSGHITAHVGDILELTVQVQSKTRAFPLLEAVQASTVFNCETESGDLYYQNNEVLKYYTGYYPTQNSPVSLKGAVPGAVANHENLKGESNGIGHLLFHNAVCVCNEPEFYSQPVTLYRLTVQVNRPGACCLSNLLAEISGCENKYARWYSMLDKNMIDFTCDMKVVGKDTSFLQPGDVDGDGRISINDATAVQRAAAERITLTEEQFVRADVNKDGKVNVNDLTDLQRYLSGYITSFA